MCTVSMITSDFQQNWPYPSPSLPLQLPQISRTEFEALKQEVESLKELLKAAKLYDEKTGQKDCEEEAKKAWMLELGTFLGVDFSEIYT